MNMFGKPKIITNTKGAAIRTIRTALYINIQVMLLFLRKFYSTKRNDRVAVRIPFYFVAAILSLL